MTNRDVAQAPSLTDSQITLLQAHHEAAHAVVAHHAGLHVDSLHVRPNSDDHGSWIEGITYITYHPRQAADFAVQGAAGEIAGLKWLDQHGLRTPETEAAANADHDRDETLALLAEDGLRMSWTVACAAATDRVDAFWSQITAVAEAATAKGHLTAQEITQAIQGSVDIRCFLYQHGAPEIWSATDFETYEHLTEIDQLTSPVTAYQPAA